MLNLKEKRIRRSQKTRKKISELGVVRLSVHRTNLHIYAQLIDNKSKKVITSASTLEPDVRNEMSSGSNIAAAAFIGKRIAEKGRKCGISQIAFDRAGYKYHGRVKALAEAARENGLKF
ncbi:50S ribosomal protein L18 [Nitrosomonas sp. Nm166]|uniref:50S ribosomal protein L18 n=1 Tax=Nitrosomonas sp. Nm166 TaxID=1881054 RepID=UPI0008E5EB31|nr:50S ribosomal protein L18 [Nitrosomonas sp. Nm166]SFE87726.1 large subunit ribosomal protein L18 [Nitrosomonas sp. Nm166]